MTTDWCSTGHVTIDILPDDILLEIFHFCQLEGMSKFDVTWEWEKLVHVCRRWRHLVFASPRHLDLRLVCTLRTRAREMLDIWPAIPIIINYSNDPGPKRSISNVIDALEHHDRVCEIRLGDLTSSQLEGFAVATQKQFPRLTFLEFGSRDAMAQALPLDFLGGAAPRLHITRLHGVPFPTLPHVLLSSRDLVELRLWDIPMNGHISPMAMVAGLSALTHLQKLSIEFRSPKSPIRPARLPRSRKLVVLPSLTQFWFRGISEYLEDLFGRIHAPLLDYVDVTLFNQLIFHLPRLVQFINRSEMLKLPKQAEMVFGNHDVMLTFCSPGRIVDFILRISCNDLDWQVSSLSQVCSQLFRLVSSVEQLDLHENESSRPRWQDDLESTQWVELFHPFGAVKTLRLSKETQSLVLRAMREFTGEMFTEVLPRLHDLFVEDLRPPQPIQESIEPFLTACRRSDNAVAVHHWER